MKGIGGFYYVRPLDSNFLSDELHDGCLECKARGILRHKKQTPMVGDIVDISRNEEGQWTIDKIEPRKNAFVRPPVSNVDTALLCFSVKKPKPDLLLLDRLIVNSLYSNIDPVLCFTKIDTDDQEVLLDLKQSYEGAGFPIIGLSPTEMKGDEAVLKAIRGKTAFLAGPSGAGKSTLANRLCASTMDTGTLSRKLGRGKHTTRHVELLTTIEDGYLLDTPGFSSLILEEGIEPDMLGSFYPEYAQFDCKYSNCSHIAEPACGVQKAVKQGLISSKRYANYKLLYDELKKRKKRY